MYRKLLPMIHRFVMIRQGALGQMYVGRLMDVDQECLELQTYQADGSPAASWTIQLSTITEFVSESRQLDTLALKVKWAASEHVPNRELTLNEDIPLGDSRTEASS